MPKSYLSDEPGARRGLQHGFDPFDQVRSRLNALESVGHPTDKVELLILGGTWSSYRRDYQEWFIRRCFDALNIDTEEFDSIKGTGKQEGSDDEPTQYRASSLIDPENPGRSVERAQILNEKSPHRNVGLVIETRPDEINPGELAWLRKLGVTKVQMGAQSLDDRVLNLNKRGHQASETLAACAMLRSAGFKIVLHWMPNLYGASLESDRLDFSKLWMRAEDGLGYCPDEIKIYPCQLLENAELYQYWLRGEYVPYTEQELIELIADIKPDIPRYCRVNRVIRDIPSTHVVAGNKRTSLRQDVLVEMERRGKKCQCVRCREVRDELIDVTNLILDDLVYHPAFAEEHFLSFVTPNDKIAGYLRLSLLQHVSQSSEPSSLGGRSSDVSGFDPFKSDLDGSALIREVHVYGQSLPVGAEQTGAAQHIGLGTRLLQAAEQIARENGFRRLAVIAAVGTRNYYEARGFGRGNLYLVKNLQG
jgi:elongator complex protein 3